MLLSQRDLSSHDRPLRVLLASNQKWKRLESVEKVVGTGALNVFSSLKRIVASF